MALATSTDLLIGQWRTAPRMRGVVRIFLDLVEEELEAAIDALSRMRSLDTAEGVWLDAIGSRLGVRRPLLTAAEVPELGNRWGFDAIGKTFDAAPFDSETAIPTSAPAGDDVYRRILISRGITIIGSPTIGTLRAALAAIDPAATAEDRTDMTVDIRAEPGWPVVLAHRLGALPIPAGVRIRLGTGADWGYDDAGQPFDRSGFSAS